jgi:hypothetical protein
MPDLLLDVMTDIRARARAYNAAAPTGRLLTEHPHHVSGGVATWHRLAYPAAYLYLVAPGGNAITLAAMFKRSEGEPVEELPAVTIMQLTTVGRTEPFVVGTTGHPTALLAATPVLDRFFAALA